MIKESFAAIGRAVRDLVTSPGGVLVLVVLYFLLLGSVYLFISTGVGTIFQVVLTGIMAAAVPIFFYLFNSASGYWGIGDTSIGQVLFGAIKGFFKFLLVSIPLIGVVVLFVWLAHKFQNRFGIAEATTTHAIGHGGIGTPIVKLSWVGVFTYTVELFVLGFVMPLIAIQFWLELARTTLLTTIRHIFRVLGRAISDGLC